MGASFTLDRLNLLGTIPHEYEDLFIPPQRAGCAWLHPAL